jgi:hypothetical protein
MQGKKKGRVARPSTQWSDVRVFIGTAANLNRLAVCCVQGKKKGRIARASTQWLDVRVFTSTADAVRELKAAGCTIWATDLNPGAVSLLEPSLQVSNCGQTMMINNQ